MKDHYTDNTTGAGKKEAGHNQDGLVPPRGSSVTPVIDVHRHCMWKTESFLDWTLEKLVKKKIRWRDNPSSIKA